MRRVLQDREASLALPVQGLEHGSANQTLRESDFVSEFGEDAFKEAVERIKEYTRAGDVMQVVLAQRMHIPFQAPSINMYRALRSLNPSPYMYFMDLDDFQIVSSSPKSLPEWKMVSLPIVHWLALVGADIQRRKTLRSKPSLRQTRKKSQSI